MARWVFEPGHTSAEFSVRHMMVTNVRGHFKNVHGVMEFDPGNPQHYEQMLDTLGQAEQHFTKGGEDSELTVRGRIRNASSNFVHGTPEPEVIEDSLKALVSSPGRHDPGDRTDR